MSRHDVLVQRLISAPIDVVFRHWTDPDERLQWCAPDPSWAADAGSDLRVGGTWWVTFGPSGGPTYRVEGVYRVVEPPHRLVYSSVFHDADGSTVSTEITVTFEARDGGTLLTVLDAGYRDEATRRRFDTGTVAVLDHFERTLRASPHRSE